MKKKLLILVVLLVATGYVLNLCFDGMNQKSDLTYIGGILGLVFWFLVVLPFVYQRVYKNKEKKNDEKNEQPVKESVPSNVANDPVAPSSGLHDENRAGDGGHRSRPVRKSKRSAGHNTEDGKGVV